MLDGLGAPRGRRPIDLRREVGRAQGTQSRVIWQGSRRSIASRMVRLGCYFCVDYDYLMIADAYEPNKWHAKLDM